VFHQSSHRRKENINSQSELKSSIRIISWIRDGGLRSRTLGGRNRDAGIRETTTLTAAAAAFRGLFWWAGARLTSSPFDGAEQSGASLVVEGDDDAGGGQVGVVGQRGTPAEGRAHGQQLTHTHAHTRTHTHTHAHTHARTHARTHTHTHTCTRTHTHAHAHTHAHTHTHQGFSWVKMGLRCSQKKILASCARTACFAMSP